MYSKIHYLQIYDDNPCPPTSVVTEYFLMNCLNFRLDKLISLDNPLIHEAPDISLIPITISLRWQLPY